MNITNIINDIENIDNITDRCISYSEVIIHLQIVKKTYYFQHTGIPWKDDINNKIIATISDTIDTKINELRDMIELNVDVKKLI